MNSVFISCSYNDNYAKSMIEQLKQASSDSIDLINDKQLLSNKEVDAFDPIKKCDFFICIFDRTNTNIMLELGYALGQNKDVILIGDFGDIPYELRNYLFINKNEDINKVIMQIIEKTMKNKSDKKLKENYCFENKDELVVMKNTELINTMNYKEFEDVIFDYLIKKNPSINIIKSKKDTMFDFLIPSLNCYIDIKKYNNNSKVSLSAIRSFLGLMIENNIKKGIVLSSVEFTLSALDFVKKVKGLEYNIILLTLNNLLESDGNLTSILKKYDESQSTATISEK